MCRVLVCWRSRTRPSPRMCTHSRLGCVFLGPLLTSPLTWRTTGITEFLTANMRRGRLESSGTKMSHLRQNEFGKVQNGLCSPAPHPPIRVVYLRDRLPEGVRGMVDSYQRASLTPRAKICANTKIHTKPGNHTHTHTSTHTNQTDKRCEE